MSGLNKVMIIGRLGKDPEIKFSQSGLAVCSMSVATSEKYKDKNSGEMVEKTEWHRCISFGKSAETLEKYLQKGSMAYFEGKLQTRDYEKDGQKHYMTEIVIQNFQFLGGKDQDNRQEKKQTQQPDNSQDFDSGSIPIDDGDSIPF